MNEDNELTDDIQSALRSVPSASADLREAHIAAAMSEISTPKKRSIPYLGIAASFLVIFGVASTIATRKDNTLPAQATAHAIALVTPPKNMAPDATVPGFPHSCYSADTRTAALYTMDTNPMQVDVTNWRVEFKNNNSCAVAAFIDIPTTTLLTEKPAECAASVPTDHTVLATFNMTGVRYRVLASSTDLILFSCATNTEVGRTNHPDYDNVID
jgi:hypothetical protein